MPGSPLDPTGALGELSALMRTNAGMGQILDDVVQLARRHVPGTDEAAITLIRHASASTVAATGPLAVELDELQYDEGYGPCLDSGRTNEIMHIEDTATEKRWPRYIPPAREHGLGSSLSLPIPVESYLVGALNLYSRTAHSFTPDAVVLGEALAVHVCAALSHAEAIHGHRSRAEHLQLAIESRAVIEQAKGILMADQKCSAQDAFDLLRRLSNNENIKLADVAASLVASASGGREPKP